MVRLWVRPGAPPKAAELLARAPRGPGRLVDVDARTADEARALLAIAQQPEPADRTTRAGREAWLDWIDARERVREVTP